MSIRYINPLSSFCFKRLFGSKVNKRLLINFLNGLLRGQECITNLMFKNNSDIGIEEFDMPFYFNLYCRSKNGEYFIIQIYKPEEYFSGNYEVLYKKFPLIRQARQNPLNLGVERVYLIGILDFVLDKKNKINNYRHEICLPNNEAAQLSCNNLSFIYLEVPKFEKSMEELKTSFEKWMFIFRYLRHLKLRPDSFSENVFKQLFETTEFQKLSPEDKICYNVSLRHYYDIKKLFHKFDKIDLEEQSILSIRIKEMRVEKLEYFVVNNIDTRESMGFEDAKGI